MLHCVQVSYKSEGWRVFFRGFYAIAFRAMIVNAATFFVYQNTLTYLTASKWCRYFNCLFLFCLWSEEGNETWKSALNVDVKGIKSEMVEENLIFCRDESKIWPHFCTNCISVGMYNLLNVGLHGWSALEQKCFKFIYLSATIWQRFEFSSMFLMLRRLLKTTVFEVPCRYYVSKNQEC